MVHALTHHLFYFGGVLSERLRTTLMVRGINMSQYATWIIILHLTHPRASPPAEAIGELVGCGVAASIVGNLAMLALGARPSRRRGDASRKKLSTD